ncbi:hypothetical protein [Mesohalobacter halotolerans]|uniref:DUF4149 domain-containing protein n=1 Tax=Mesohalobacter halotolerans TaxID=1883405 RepID=A0A4V6ALH3_9FLAO|nr:hypothetical protein [Mesohalobacter halotolerans]MBS3739528.1 hypothetical protein [Psychroflexus sp.]TKS56625.1 hypothetical protein FCN74_06225 [Mesohalobacter halotolerans]
MQIDHIYMYKLIPDIGLMVLIWLVQLIIYPSFRYYNPNNLKSWHRPYTSRITVVVLPLMLSQIVISIILLLISNWSSYYIIDSLLVLLTWVLTFVIFVPLHQNIDKNQEASASVSQLIKYNWLRTILWSLIALLSIYKTLIVN